MKHGLPKIKDMGPGDFKNNDYLLRMAEKLNRYCYLIVFLTF